MTKPLTAADAKYIPKNNKLPTMELARVIPYARNARTHSDKQVAEIAALIREFGFRMPIGVSFDEGGKAVRLWAGHGRVLAAHKLGMTAVTFVDWSDLSDTQRRALALADNKVALNAGWDDNLLSLELKELGDAGVDLAITGFNEAEINNLMPPEEEPAAPAADLPANPVSRAGDVWTLGPHRLMCGDSTLATDVAMLLGQEKPFLMDTDPPYGVNYDPTHRIGHTRADGSKVKSVSAGLVTNDDKANWLAAWKLFPGDVAYVWHADKTSYEVEGSLRDAGFEKRATIIWDKGVPTLSKGNYHWQHEPCLYVVRNGRPGRWAGDRKQSTVWNIARNMGFTAGADEKTPGDEHTAHGTQKPVECMRRPILNNSTKGDAVYDPFVGSGTTIIACERTGRRAFAMDCTPGYVDISIERWQKETGRKATLEGRSFEEVRADRLGKKPE